MAKSKILIIDDEEDFLTITGARIEGWGYQAVLAHSGREGLEKLKADPPQIVLLDYLMPGMDGIDTLKKIREIDKKIPVIIFTAYPDMRVMNETDGMGVVAFIDKLGVVLDMETALKSAIKLAEKVLKG